MNTTNAQSAVNVTTPLGKPTKAFTTTSSYTKYEVPYSSLVYQVNDKILALRTRKHRTAGHQMP